MTVGKVRLMATEREVMEENVREKQKFEAEESESGGKSKVSAREKVGK
jgi:hypothetical protein